jgi:hypothetical protein
MVWCVCMLLVTLWYIIVGTVRCGNECGARGVAYIVATRQMSNGEGKVECPLLLQVNIGWATPKLQPQDRRCTVHGIVWYVVVVFYARPQDGLVCLASGLAAMRECV